MTDSSRDPYNRPSRVNVLSRLFAFEIPNTTADAISKGLAADYGLVRIEGCTRTMVFGLGNVPEALQNNASGTLYTGANAYARLLEYQTGLLSNARGETQIVGQFKEAFAKREQEHPESLENYTKLYAWLAEDNNSIRSCVTHDLQSAYFETIAQRVVPREKGAPVVIWIDETVSGKLSDTTKNILRQLASFGLNKPETIYITHPDSHVLDRHMSLLKRMHDRGSISASVIRLSFDDLLSSPYEKTNPTAHKNIFICPACNSNPTAEHRLIEWQKEASALGYSITHLGGNKGQRISQGEWVKNLDNVVLPEDISAEQERQKIKNEKTVNEGKDACTKCALSRDNGKRPLKHSLDLPLKDYAHASNIALVSLGRER